MFTIFGWNSSSILTAQTMSTVCLTSGPPTGMLASTKRSFNRVSKDLCARDQELKSRQSISWLPVSNFLCLIPPPDFITLFYKRAALAFTACLRPESSHTEESVHIANSHSLRISWPGKSSPSVKSSPCTSIQTHLACPRSAIQHHSKH